VVELAAGSYGDQTIEADPSKTSSTDVVFRPAAGASVAAGDVTVAGADHFELRDLQLDGWHTLQGTDDVTFRNITGREFYVDSSFNISVVGGSYGPDTDLDNAQIRAACSTCPAPTGILIDGVRFHDAVNSPGSDAHTECLQIGDINGLTIRNSSFTNCEHHSVFMSPWWYGALRNITLENNTGSGVRTGYYGFRIAAGVELCENVVFRNNSNTSPFGLECGTTAGTVKLVGNVGPYVAWACRDYAVYRYNVWDGASCAATDLNAASGFVNAAAGDLHLRAGAAAVDRGDPTDAPAADADGRSRPRGAGPDAGAYES
jgi:hypothetical protein